MTISSGKKKTYRIKHEIRFTIFVTFLILITAIFLSSVLGLNTVSSLTYQEYMEITVKHGDTLWNIVQTYMPEYDDIRKAIHLLCNINEIQAHELKAGQVLRIPVW